MTPKYLLPCTVGLSVVILSSCVPPFVPYDQRPPLRAVDPALGPGSQTVDTAEQKRLKETKREVSETTTRSTDSGAGTPPTTTTGGGTSGDNGTAQPRKPNYPYALPIPGKDGFVFNPFTNNPVDVRGIPSGTLVRDPQDSNPDHKFRVP